MGFNAAHRVALFIAGLSMLSDIALVPGLVGLSKPAIALLAVTTVGKVVATRTTLRFGAKSLWVGLFTAMLAVSFVFSVTQGLPFRYIQTLAISYLSVIGFYYLLCLAISSVEEASALIWGLVVSGTVSATSVLLGYGATAPDDRTGGLSGDPNYFAMGVSASALVAIYPLIRSRSLIVRAGLCAAIGVMVAGSFASLSRGGFLALGIASAFLVYRMIQWGHRMVAIPALVAVLALPLVLPQHVRDRMLTLTTSNARLDASVQTRVSQYRRALSFASKNPLLGVGAGRSNLSEALGGAISRQDLRSFSVSQRTYHVIHNTFLIILVEGGILLLMPYVMIFLLSWVELSRVARVRWTRSYSDDPSVRSLVWLGAMLQAGFVALTIAGLFLSAARFKPLWMVFGLATAISTLVAARIRATPAEKVAPVAEPEALPSHT